MKQIIYFIFTLTVSAFIPHHLLSQEYLNVSGLIIDQKTRKPLPYASIGIANRHEGTISNQNGFFSMYLVDSLLNDTLIINYLGYESFIAPIDQLEGKNNQIKLRPVSTRIEEVVIRPLTPEDILERVKENYSINYPQNPFIAEGFYLQEIIENDIYIDFVEAYVDIYNPPYNDTSKCHARLVQGRTREDLGDIQFLKRLAEKQYEKQVRKALRKGDTIDTVATPSIQIIFGGPQSIAEEANIRNINNFYDKKTFKKFNYIFEENTWFAGRELYVIRAKSKRKIDHASIDAQLFIDKESYALVILKADMNFDIPAVLKPVLSLLRIKLHGIQMSQNVEYKMVNNRWYPHKTITTGYFEGTKKYKGKYEEYSYTTIKKAFVATDIQNKDVKPFPEEELLTDKPLREQIGEYEPTFWQNRTKIEYQIN